MEREELTVPYTRRPKPRTWSAEKGHRSASHPRPRLTSQMPKVRHVSMVLLAVAVFTSFLSSLGRGRGREGRLTANASGHAQTEEVEEPDTERDHDSAPEYTGGLDHLGPPSRQVQPHALILAQIEDGHRREDADQTEHSLQTHCYKRFD